MGQIKKPLRDRSIEIRKAQELEAAGRSLASIANAMADAVCITDLNSNITMVNQTMEDLFEMPREKLLTIRGPDLASSDDAAIISDAMEHLFRTGLPQSVEVTGGLGKAKDRSYWMKFSLLKDEKEEPLGIVTVARDITEQNRMKKERIELLRRYEDRIRELKCLLGVSRIAETPHTTLELVAKRAVDLIPAGYQHPGIACARIALEEEVFQTGNFKETPWKQQADITLHGKKIGAVEVYYLVEKPRLYEVPFLREEQQVLDAIASRLGKIAERLRAEEALAMSEALQRNIFESARDGLVYCTKFGTIEKINSEGLRLFGGAKEDVVGKHFTRIGVFSLGDLPRVAAAFAGVLLGKSQFMRLHIKNKRAEEIDLECSASLVKNHGEVSGVTIVARNVTERERLEQAVRESEEAYRNLVERAPDGMVVLDMEGVVKSVNPAFTEFTGHSKNEVVGKHFTKLDTVSKKAIPEYLRLFESISRGKTGQPVECLIFPKDGGTLWGEAHAALVKKRGKTVGIQVLLRDITARKKAEEKLRAYSQHLEEMVSSRTKELKEVERMAAIGETAAMVGHDLRNPLQAMFYTLYSVEGKLGSMPSELRRALEEHGLLDFKKTISDQLEYINKIVSDLQDYARPMKPKAVPTDVLELINETLSAVSIPENVKLSTAIPRDFMMPRVDPALMRRLLTNLVANALQAMPDGGRLTITASKKDDSVLLSVQDTGVGIPEEHVPRLFEPLFTTKPKGQGLGLPVCKRIADTHGGSITVESQVGKGSTFTVRIPVEKEVR